MVAVSSVLHERAHSGGATVTLSAVCIAEGKMQCAPFQSDRKETIAILEDIPLQSSSRNGTYLSGGKNNNNTP